jgi:hypothetical protein
MTRRLSHIVGVALLTISCASAIQTGRELLLREYGRAHYTERLVDTRSVDFGNHRVIVNDDQPVETSRSSEVERRTPASAWILVDGRMLGSPAPVEVRPT